MGASYADLSKQYAWDSSVLLRPWRLSRNLARMACFQDLRSPLLGVEATERQLRILTNICCKVHICKITQHARRPCGLFHATANHDVIYQTNNGIASVNVVLLCDTLALLGPQLQDDTQDACSSSGPQRSICSVGGRGAFFFLRGRDGAALWRPQWLGQL